MLSAAALAALLCAGADVLAKEPRLKVALTFDDLPINGPVPGGVSLTQLTRETVAVLKKHRIPASYGFINASKLEGNSDGAEALKVWVAAGHPVGNHTYTHIDLTRNSAEDCRPSPATTGGLPLSCFRSQPCGSPAARASSPGRAPSPKRLTAMAAATEFCVAVIGLPV